MDQNLPTFISLDGTPQVSFALRGKNVGCSLRLRGKVVLVAFLVDDAKSSWDDASRQLFTSVLRRACLRLMKESGLDEHQLSITYATADASVPYEVSISTADQLTKDVLQAYECKDSQSFQKLYEQSKRRDEACITFVVNRPLRSFAQRIVSADGLYRDLYPVGNEYSVVSFRRSKLKRSENSLIHELLHQFGAMDYYTPPAIEKLALRFFPDSIMNDGDRIDQLTRYVIGWDDTLSPEAKAFVDLVEALPPDQRSNPPKKT